MHACRIGIERSSRLVLLLLLFCALATVRCSSGSGFSTSDPAVVADLVSVLAAADHGSDAEGAARWDAVERKWWEKLQPDDYGQLANDLCDLNSPVSARAVLDAAQRRFGGNPEIADQIDRLRERVRIVEMRIELSSPTITDYGP
jgi:hypothetical protein